MIAAGIAVGPYPRALAAGLIATGEVEEFDPGFQPSPLEFTASFLGEPRNVLAERGAELAQEIAQAWDKAHEQ